MIAKALKIKDSLRKTKERRKHQKPIVFQLKLQNLSKKKLQILERVFLEAKWLYNFLVCNLENLGNVNKIKSVRIKVKDSFEERTLEVLGSQIKQEIADRIKDNLKALKKLKEKGQKVGKLKPKPFVNSISLKQYGITYSIDFKRNRVRIQKLGKFRVLGLHQIPEEAEIANAVLVRTPDGFYLHVTCYLPKDFEQYFRKDRKGNIKAVKREKLKKPVAVDFGAKNKLTLSNGMIIDFEVGETKRLKKLQRVLARRKRGSKRWKKTLMKLRKEHQRIVNRRKDCQNKILAFLKIYSAVVFQDDCIKYWHENGFGKNVQHSGIGGLKSRLSNSLETPIPIERFENTTSECFVCGNKQKMEISERVFRCKKCGYVNDRDLNAAWIMLRKGLGLPLNSPLPVVWWEVTPVEREASARILGSNPYIRVSSLAEAGNPAL